MSVTLSTLLWKLSSTFSMCGTLVPYPTDISRSLIAVCHEFAFPIGYSTNKHWELTSSPTSIESYSKDLATHLSALCEVAQLLVQNTMLTIVSSSIPVAQILARTPLATLYSPTMLFDLMHPKNVSTNCPTNSLDLGKPSRPSKALCTSSNIAQHQIGKRRNMHQIYLLIQWS
jgi:hypothetical protein